MISLNAIRFSRRRMFVFFSSIFLLFVVLSYLTLKTVAQSKQDKELAIHTTQVLHNITRVRSMLKDKVLCATAYVVAKDTTVLEQTEGFNDSIVQGIEQLRLLTTDNAIQHKRMVTISQFALSRINFADSLVLLHRKYGRSVSESMLAANIRNYHVRQINDMINEFELEETRLLQIGQQESLITESRLSSILLLSIIISFIVIVIVFVIISRQLEARMTAEKTINQMNSDLEQKVKQKAEALVYQELRYKEILEYMLEGAQIIGKDWTYLYLNDVAEQQSKMSRKELIGNNMLEVYPTIAGTQLHSQLSKCITDKESSVFQNEFLFPDGSIGYFELRIEPIPEGVFILSIDISDKILKEQERTRRVEESKAILYKISHEIRQPVANIIGVSTLLDNELISEHELSYIANAMKESALQLDIRTRNLSDFVHTINNDGQLY